MLKVFERKQKGFTLIELLVVISIIGILSSIVLISMGGAREKARDAKRNSDIRQVATALELKYSDDEEYLTYGPAASDVNYASLKAAGIGTYMTIAAMPDDPTSGATYYWFDNDASGEEQHFCVWAVLESPSPTEYVIASERGVKTSTTLPTGLENLCW